MSEKQGLCECGKPAHELWGDTFICLECMIILHEELNEAGLGDVEETDGAR
jgi:hypothetical protein